MSGTGGSDPDRLQAADRRSRRILERLFGPPDTWLFRVQLPGGLRLGNPGSPEFVLRLRHPGALRAALLPPTERSAGEAFVDGVVDVEGDLEAAIRSFRESVLDRRPRPTDAAAVLWDLLALPHVDRGEARAQDLREEGAAERSGRGRRHSAERDAAAVRRHYDVGNEFYDLWLDPWMQYSSAYFPTGRESLARAQEAKLDLVCQKLGLSEGDRLLDVGCGWGGLARYACREFGVEAVGITVSRAQAERARRDVEADGLDDRCRIELRDYRELYDDGSFDRAVSVGMVEHVGRDQMAEYFRSVAGALRSGGRFLNVGIVDPGPPRGAARRLWHRLRRRSRSFVEAHVFPDGELVSPVERIKPALEAGFELCHAEDLREHYALTLRHWVGRLEDRWGEATRRVGEATARTWRLYMAGSAHAFQTGRLGLLHELYAKPGPDASAQNPSPPPFSRPGYPRP